MYDVDILERMDGNGKKRRYAVYKGKKFEIPHVFKRADGRRHIKFKKKKIILSEDISERELIKFIIQQLAPNKVNKHNKKRKRKTVYREVAK